jgi:hypothetical protein
MMPENGPGRMNSEGESCHSGKLHLPFARLLLFEEKSAFHKLPIVLTQAGCL